MHVSKWHQSCISVFATTIMQDLRILASRLLCPEATLEATVPDECRHRYPWCVLPVSVSVSLSLSLSVSSSLFISLCLSSFLFVSLRISLSLFVSLCLSSSLSLSLSLSLFVFSVFYLPVPLSPPLHICLPLLLSSYLSLSCLFLPLSLPVIHSCFRFLPFPQNLTADMATKSKANVHAILLGLHKEKTHGRRRKAWMDGVSATALAESTAWHTSWCSSPKGWHARTATSSDWPLHPTHNHHSCVIMVWLTPCTLNY